MVGAIFRAKVWISAFTALHSSFGRPSPDVGYEPFVWNRMRDPGLVTLNIPRSLICNPVSYLTQIFYGMLRLFPNQ